MKRTRVFTTLLAIAALAIADRSDATPIASSAFGGATVIESFEAVPLGPNIRIGMGVSLLEPGTVSAFSFASGVTLTAPVPNPGVLNRGAFVHDLARGTDVQNNWGATGVVNDPTDVPFGDAYLGAFHPTGAGTASFTLSFATPMDRVGAFFTGAAASTVTMRVYDASGTLLETVSGSTVTLAGWNTNFLGIQRPEQISRVTFTGTDFGIDGLHFENDLLLVPEPSTLPAMALGLLGLWGLAASGARSRSGARATSRS